jgi:hypothetical protein
LQPYNLAILCRRLQGKYKAPRSQHLEERLKEIRAGKYHQELQNLKILSPDELKKHYGAREIEPEI